MSKIQIKPSHDSVICCFETLVEVYFSRIPDPEIASDLYSIEENSPLIEVKGYDRQPRFLGSSDCSSSASSKPDTYFTISIPPTYDSNKVAIEILHCLRDDHGLNVKTKFFDDDDKNRQMFIGTRI